MTNEQSTEQLKGKAWTAASRELRNAHHAEWLERLEAQYRKLGLTWTPRPTAEERARAQLDELLAQHPALIDHVAERVVQGDS
jgi:hypothetical protein